MYDELRSNVKGIELTKYNELPTNESGIKKAIGIPNGVMLEVYNASTGKIVIYAEAINELWYER